MTHITNEILNQAADLPSLNLIQWFCDGLNPLRQTDQNPGILMNYSGDLETSMILCYKLPSHAFQEHGYVGIWQTVPSQ